MGIVLDTMRIPFLFGYCLAPHVLGFNHDELIDFTGFSAWSTSGGEQAVPWFTVICSIHR
jgi:hypothetical protein